MAQIMVIQEHMWYAQPNGANTTNIIYIINWFKHIIVCNTNVLYTPKHA